MLKPRFLASLVIAVLCLASVALGREPSFEEHAVVQESLARVHPRMRASWLRARGLDDSYYTTFHRPESTGLRCIGRWPWGPSWELAGRDTFLYLGSGSGVRILSIADSVHPRMLGQIIARSLVSQVGVQDTLLFVACGSWGAQIYSVSDPANPRELGSMDAVIGDLCVQDTFCYTAGDNFRIYNFANPMQPTQVGVVGDGGDVIAEVNGYAYVGHGSSGSGLNVYDVSDPSSPALVNTLGGVQLSLFVRGQMLFRTSVQPSYFQILDVSDPTSIHEIGRIDGYGGIGLYADDYFAYLSCTYDHEGLFVIDISNPANPQLRDSLDPEGTDKWDSYVPAEVSYGYLASGYGGLVALDLHNVDSICEAWSGYKADRSIDIVVDGPRAYVANKLSGLQILYVGDPTAPVTLGLYDTVGARNTYTAVASDSFAFISRTGQPRFYFRVLDVTDPVLPVPVAQETCTSWPLDMVLRDSFCYAAGINRFFVFNVARPREPVLVGSCASTDGTDFALAVLDTFAYIAADMTQVIDVARPDSPYVVTTIGRASWDLSIVDSMLFCEPGPAIWYSLANPAVPVPIDSIDMGHWITGMTAVNRTIYACSGPSYSTLYAISIADLHQPRVIAQASLPYVAKRITYAAPYLYLSCEDAGVCIYETTQVGVQEPSQNASRRMKPMPTVVRGAEWRKVTQDALVFDAIGRRVTQARPGVYFIVEEPQASSHKLQAVRKVVLTE